MLVIWGAVFVVSFAALVKGADWVIESAEKIGVYFGLPSFVIGVLIVGVGTSLPELASGLSAVWQGSPEIVAANVVGSNIANILLIVGITAVIAGKLVVTRDLIDLELPLFATATILFVATAFDGVISFTEALFLFATYLVYLIYTMSSDNRDPVMVERGEEIKRRAKITPRVIVTLIAGLAGLILGARYLVTSAVEIADFFSVSAALVSLLAIAIGTSLPELVTSLRALKQKKTDIAVGNIFGSNAFNMLMVTGVPGIFSTLPLVGATFSIGLPVLGAASAIFFISAISRNIYRWEGFMFVIFYIFFLFKLFGIG